MLSNSPVTDCNACSLGLASQGRCRLTPASRESGATICAQGERPRTVYFVKEGFVSLSSVSRAAPRWRSRCAAPPPCSAPMPSREIEEHSIGVAWFWP